MDFTFSAEQVLLRDSVSRCLAGSYSFDQRRAILASDRGASASLWRQFGELGLLALPFPQALGGLGGSVTDLVAVADPFGRYLVGEPYLSSVLLAGRALALTAQHEVAREWLARIVDGTALAAFAHEEGRGTADPARIRTTARPDADSIVLTGQKRLVLGAGEADVLVVSARGDDNRLTLVAVAPDAPGVSLTRVRTVDGRTAAHCRFDDVRVAATQLLDADAEDAINSVVSDAIVWLCAEAVGVMTALLETTIGYAATRRQFGVPIASFQALAHRLADMRIAVVIAWSTLLYTTALVDSGAAGPRDVSVLKAQVGRLGRAVAESAVQVHGGIGTTDEIAVGHYLKRIVALEALFGDSDYHVRRVGRRC